MVLFFKFSGGSSQGIKDDDEKNLVGNLEVDSTLTFRVWCAAIQNMFYGSYIYPYCLGKTSTEQLPSTWIRDGGMKGLFTGIGPRVGRAGPSVGIVVSFYELVKYALHHRRLNQWWRGTGTELSLLGESLILIAVGMCFLSHWQFRVFSQERLGRFLKVFCYHHWRSCHHRMSGLESQQIILISPLLPPPPPKK